MGYQIIKKNQNLYQILDSYDDCIYVVIGSKRSVVIDLGMDREDIKPIIESLITTPYDVILTHGHIDHVGRSGEFDHVFMSSQDKDVYLDNYLMNDPHDQFHTQGLSFLEFSQIQDVNHTIDLGDRKLYIVPCYGHTPGSICVVDLKEKNIFTGDAIGSGCGVWMQVDHALSIQGYHDSLVHCLHQFYKYGVDMTWNFYGGHAYQEFQSQVSSYNPLNIELLGDMIQLCQLLINHQVNYREIQTRSFSTGQPYYACYHKAEIIFTLSQL